MHQPKSKLKYTFHLKNPQKDLKQNRVQDESSSFITFNVFILRVTNNVGMFRIFQNKMITFDLIK